MISAFDCIHHFFFFFFPTIPTTATVMNHSNLSQTKSALVVCVILRAPPRLHIFIAEHPIPRISPRASLSKADFMTQITNHSHSIHPSIQPSSLVPCSFRFQSSYNKKSITSKDLICPAQEYPTRDMPPTLSRLLHGPYPSLPFPSLPPSRPVMSLVTPSPPNAKKCRIHPCLAAMSTTPKVSKKCDEKNEREKRKKERKGK